ncbi:hypothetical protein ACVINI_001384 [Rhizobium beringeri]
MPTERLTIRILDSGASERGGNRPPAVRGALRRTGFTRRVSRVRSCMSSPEAAAAAGRQQKLGQSCCRSMTDGAHRPGEGGGLIPGEATGQDAGEVARGGRPRRQTRGCCVRRRRGRGRRGGLAWALFFGIQAKMRLRLRSTPSIRLQGWCSNPAHRARRRLAQWNAPASHHRRNGDGRGCRHRLYCLVGADLA